MITNQQVFEPGEYRCTSGKTIPDVRIGYETCGTLSREKDNAILVCHYFSGNAHAAGPASGSDAQPGWWDTAIGPGKALRLLTLTALSYDVLGEFGYAPADESRHPSESLANEFRADAMLDEIARARAQALDAASFVYMVRAFKLYDVRERLHRAHARYLFLPAETDLVFPPHLSAAAVDELRAAGLEAELFMLKGTAGHLDGLSNMDQARNVLGDFLSSR